MFAALMPVFKSERCVNCHGGTIPDQDINHAGGEVPVPREPNGDMMRVGTGSNEKCVECHDLPEIKFTWRLAPGRLSFVGRDTKQLCRQLHADPHEFNLKVASGRSKFLHHLLTDKLIVDAFAGDKGFAGDEHPERPPMNHQTFIALARRWLEDGEGACADLWNGTITETTTSTQKQSFAPVPGGREVKADTRVAITVRNSEATGVVRWDMRDFTDVPTRTCATYNHNSWSVLKNNVPMEVTFVLVEPLPKSVAAAMPTAPALPPGVQLPAGFPTPEQMNVPGAGESFFRFQAPQLVAGQHRSDIRSTPGCQQVVAEAKYDYHVEGAMHRLQGDAEGLESLQRSEGHQDPRGNSHHRLGPDPRPRVALGQFRQGSMPVVATGSGAPARNAASSASRSASRSGERLKSG